MTQEEFDKTKFHAKMIIKYHGLFYDLAGVDFGRPQLGLRLHKVTNIHDILWVGIDDITIYYE